jgi:hypothetical protein
MFWNKHACSHPGCIGTGIDGRSWPILLQKSASRSQEPDFFWGTAGGAGLVRPLPLGPAKSDRGRLWADDLREPPQILCDRCERELELRSAGAAQTQSIEPQNALEVRE